VAHCGEGSTSGWRRAVDAIVFGGGEGTLWSPVAKEALAGPSGGGKSERCLDLTGGVVLVALTVKGKRRRRPKIRQRGWSSGTGKLQNRVVVMVRGRWDG
jgi:hypothetical protein